jgi:hypothetical protein
MSRRTAVDVTTSGALLWQSAQHVFDALTRRAVIADVIGELDDGPGGNRDESHPAVVAQFDDWVAPEDVRDRAHVVRGLRGARDESYHDEPHGSLRRLSTAGGHLGLAESPRKFTGRWRTSG